MASLSFSEESLNSYDKLQQHDHALMLESYGRIASVLRAQGYPAIRAVNVRFVKRQRLSGAELHAPHDFEEHVQRVVPHFLAHHRAAVDLRLRHMVHRPDLLAAVLLEA